jgi:hypothetical protein
MGEIVLSYHVLPTHISCFCFNGEIHENTRVERRLYICIYCMCPKNM